MEQEIFRGFLPGAGSGAGVDGKLLGNGPTIGNKHESGAFVDQSLKCQLLEAAPTFIRNVLTREFFWWRQVCFYIF